VAVICVRGARSHILRPRWLEGLEQRYDDWQRPHTNR